MGNSVAFTTFEHTIITLYNKGILDLELLDTLAKGLARTDISSLGSMDLTTRDGKDLETVCIELVDPAWKPESEPGSEDYRYELHDKFCKLRRRWDWY